VKIEEKRKKWRIVRDTKIGGRGGQETIFPVLKVSRLCPLFLLV
jgi:hypothetical protein